MFLGLAAAALAVGLGLWFVLGRSAEPVATGTEADSPVAPTQPAAASQTQQPSKPAEPPVITTLNVTSQPERAEVFADGRLVGSTPYTMTKPDPSKPVKLKLHLAGYEDKQIEISEQSSDVLVQLEQLAKEPSKEAPKAASRPKSSAPTPTTSPKKPQPAAPSTGKPAKRDTPAPSTDVLDPWN